MRFKEWATGQQRQRQLLCSAIRALTVGDKAGLAMAADDLQDRSDPLGELLAGDHGAAKAVERQLPGGSSRSQLAYHGGVEVRVNGPRVAAYFYMPNEKSPYWVIFRHNGTFHGVPPDEVMESSVPLDTNYVIAGKTQIIHRKKYDMRHMTTWQDNNEPVGRQLSLPPPSEGDLYHIAFRMAVK